MIRPIVSNFVDAAVAHLRRLEQMLALCSSTPTVMIDESIRRQGDWCGWKPIASSASQAEFERVENAAGISLPGIYREFLQYQHFIELTDIGVRFLRHEPKLWTGHYLEMFSWEWVRPTLLFKGLLPIGTESMQETGVVCLDMRSRTESDDCPVVFFDSEMGWGDDAMRPMFSSCASMFSSLTMAANADVAFWRPMPDDDARLAERKRELFASFVAVDDGPGMTLRHKYWRQFFGG